MDLSFCAGLCCFFLQSSASLSSNSCTCSAFCFLSQGVSPQTHAPLAELLESLKDLHISPTYKVKPNVRFKMVVDTTLDDTLLHLLMQQKTLVDMPVTFSSPFPADSAKKVRTVCTFGSLIKLFKAAYT